MLPVLVELWVCGLQAVNGQGLRGAHVRPSLRSFRGRPQSFVSGS